MRLGALLSILLLAVVLSGCAQRVTDFTVLSTKNVELDRVHEFERHDGRVRGVDRTHIIVAFPTSIPNIKEAIDQAIESVPGGVAMVDGVVTLYWFYLPLLYGQQWYSVRGDVLVDPRRLQE